MISPAYLSGLIVLCRGFRFDESRSWLSLNQRRVEPVLLGLGTLVSNIISSSLLLITFCDLRGLDWPWIHPTASHVVKHLPRNVTLTMTRTLFLLRAIFLGVLLVSHVCQGKLGGEPRELQQQEQAEPEQQHRQLVSLKNLGAEPPIPLQSCEGDCDSDSDCASGLKCLQRNGGEKVPGCDGNDGSRTDYCYSPSSGSPSGPAPSPGKQLDFQVPSGRLTRVSQPHISLFVVDGA
jgi:hypothetical protein